MRCTSTAIRVVVTFAVTMLALCSCTRNPDESTPKTPKPVDQAALSKAIDDYQASGPAPLRNVRAVLVSIDGSTVVSRYYGSDAGEHENVHGVTASLVGALVGIAISDGMIAGVEQTLANLLPNH